MGMHMAFGFGMELGGAPTPHFSNTMRLTRAHGFYHTKSYTHAPTICIMMYIRSIASSIVIHQY
jgi:hypothetical protein